MSEINEKPQKPKRKPIQTHLFLDAVEKLESLAKKEHRSISQMIAIFVDEGLKARGGM